MESASLPDLMDLGRRSRSSDLERVAAAARASNEWTAAGALDLAAAWLLAGNPHQADLALLEADRLDPSLGLVPDVWGLWPAPEPEGNPEQRRQAEARTKRYWGWRQPDCQAIWQDLLPRLQSEWRTCLEPPLIDELLILGHASGCPGSLPLDPPLEQALVGLVADAEIAAEPAASLRYWTLLATIRPRWDLARIRAADLALSRGDQEACARWLSDPPAEFLGNPWFHDVQARHALAVGRVNEALDAWAEAIRLTKLQQEGDSLSEIFEQRRREARRGAGVLQVRSLSNRGDAIAAQALLQRLLKEDPQWQPLRSLHNQLLHSRPAAAEAIAAAPADVPAPSRQPPAGLDGLLERAAARLRILGHPIPEPVNRSEAFDMATYGSHLAELERRLSDYEARFALA
ncbi:MAG: hypothetical protein ACKO8I_11900 [Cyanobacteriota bacterium]